VPAKKVGIKFGLSIAVVIICLVAAEVAVYWIKTEPIEPTGSNVNIKKTNNETASWQTYRNEKYGFEVKYPKEITSSLYNPLPSVYSLRFGNLPSYISGLQISIDPGTEAGMGTDIVSIGNLKVSGGCRSNFDASLSENLGFAVWYYPLGATRYNWEHVYEYSIGYKTNQTDKACALFDQILSTFKFTP